MKDSYLWDKFRTGDKSAIERIYFSHFEKLIQYGYRFTSNFQLLEDCIQDLFIYLINNHKSLGKTDNITYYLFKSLRRRIAKSIKEHSFNIDYTTLPKTIQLKNETGYEINDISHNEYHPVFKILNNLPSQQKEIVYLKYCNNLSNQEIADILDIKNQTVRNLLYRALRTLRQHIKSTSFQKKELVPYTAIICLLQSSLL